jgi:hypothetical protein
MAQDEPKIFTDWADSENLPFWFNKEACNPAKIKNEKETRSPTWNLQGGKNKYGLSLLDTDSDIRGVICHNPVRIEDVEVFVLKWRPCGPLCKFYFVDWLSWFHFQKCARITT